MWRRRPVPRAARTLAVGLLAAGIALAVGATGVLDQVELQSVDKRFAIRGKQQVPDDVVVVGIDDKTFVDLRRRFPFPRSLHARVIDELTRAGAAAVAYDVQFSEASTPLEDAALLTAAKRAGRRLVLATTQLRNDDLDVIDRTGLRDAGVGIGDADFATDDDGVFRRMTATVRNVPQFAFLAAQRATNHPIPLGPVKGDGAWIDFAGPPDTGRQAAIREIPFSDVLTGRFDPAEVRGKLVVVGATARSLQDLHQTSVGGLMPGPELVANAAHTALAGFPISDAPGWLEPVMAVLAGLLAPLATLRGRPGRAMLRAFLAAVAGLVVLLVGVQAAFNADLVVELMVPLLALVLGTAGATTLAYVTEVRARRRTRATFERFVPKQVVGELLETNDPSPRLPGQRVEATVVFCDLRGFTTLAEQLDGDQVIDVLDRWFNEMGDAVLDNGGTLVSFQGDGIMSVFGAPIHVPDHAAQALAAAREMLDVRLPGFNAWLEEQGVIDEPKRMGIGINTGTIMSGSVGSDRRLEYAAVGDATNTASRLQSLSKQSEHQLFVAQSTRDALGDADGLVMLGPVDLPGRREPCTVWTLG
jgi:adenylate cyclase